MVAVTADTCHMHVKFMCYACEVDDTCLEHGHNMQMRLVCYECEVDYKSMGCGCCMYGIYVYQLMICTIPQYDFLSTI